MTPRATPFVLALACFALAACGRVDDGVEVSSTNVLEASTIDPLLLQKVVDAPSKVAWSGRRRFEAHYAFQGAPVDLVYEETVTTDGAGRFELRPEDLITPSLSPSQEALFLLSQQNREGLMFRRRDPTVRDAALFLDSYTVTDAGVVEQLLARDCARWSVQPNAGGNVWTLWIDLATGVILKSEERDAGQALVSSLVYLDFDDTPDTSQAVWYASPLQESPLDLSQAKAQLGFDPQLPKLLPANFRLVESERVVEPVDNRTWARLTYSDGWSEFVFMDGGPMTSPQAAQGISPDADVLRYVEAGPWVIAEGRVDSRRLLAAVRGNLGLLKLLVETAVY